MSIEPGEVEAADQEIEELKGQARDAARERHESDEIKVYDEDGVDLDTDGGVWVMGALWVPDEALPFRKDDGDDDDEEKGDTDE